MLSPRLSPIRLAATSSPLAVLAGLCAACFGRPTYECAGSEQCVVGDVMGVCEPDGLCSYADDACASGRRYGPYAGDKAEACVPTDGASTGDTTSTMTGTSAPTEPSTSSSVGPSTSEATDTGCTTDCPEPAEVLWSTVATDLGVGRAHGVAVGASGVAIAGEATIEDRIALVVATFAVADGEPVGSFAWPAPAGGPDRGQAIAAFGDGALAVAGTETTAAGDPRGVVFRLEGERTVAWSRRYETAGDDALHGVAVDASDRVVAVGTSGSRAVVLGLDAQGNEVYARVFAAPADFVSASLRTVAVTEGGEAVLGGALATSGSASDLWLRRLGVDGAVLLDVQVEDPTSAADVAFAVATIPDGGSLVGGVVAADAWLARYTPGGTVDHAGTVQDGGGSIRGLAVVGDGTLVAVGHADGVGDRDAWVAGFDLDGEPLWSRITGVAGDDEAFGVTVSAGVAYVAGVRDDAIWIAAYAL